MKKILAPLIIIYTAISWFCHTNAMQTIELPENDSFFNCCFGKNTDPATIQLGMMLYDTPQFNPKDLSLFLFNPHHEISKDDLLENLMDITTPDHPIRESASCSMFEPKHSLKLTLQKNDDRYDIYFNSRRVAQFSNSFLPDQFDTLKITLYLLLNTEKQVETFLKTFNKSPYHDAKINPEGYFFEPRLMFELESYTFDNINQQKITRDFAITQPRYDNLQANRGLIPAARVGNYNMLSSTYNTTSLLEISIAKRNQQIEKKNEAQKQQREEEKKQLQIKQTQKAKIVLTSLAAAFVVGLLYIIFRYH